MSASRIRAVIADDEPGGRTNVRVLLGQHPDVEIVAECSTGAETTRAIRELEPDLLFLDVRMPGKDGISALNDIPRSAIPVVVFVTAYEEYALPAFGFAAADYLLKPYSDSRFHEAMERAKARIEHASLATLRQRLLSIADDARDSTEPRRIGTAYPERMAIPSANAVNIVDVSSISWIEATGDYVRIHTNGQAHLVRGTMTGVGRTLDPTTFVRVHRSTIVNVAFVRELRHSTATEYVLVLRDGTTRPVSARGREELAQALHVRL
jgi:two-component system, LytTR family, response regulator